MLKINYNKLFIHLALIACALVFILPFLWVLAASAMIIPPILIMFFFAQKTFVEGIALSGMKE